MMPVGIFFEYIPAPHTERSWLTDFLIEYSQFVRLGKSYNTVDGGPHRAAELSSSEGPLSPLKFIFILVLNAI